MKLKDRITDLKNVAGAFGLMFTIAVLFVSVLTFLIVGAWDGAVWLFKADWQTTNFQVPFWAFVVTIPAYLFNRMFADWMTEVTEQKLKELEENRNSRTTGWTLLQSNSVIFATQKSIGLEEHRQDQRPVRPSPCIVSASRWSPDIISGKHCSFIIHE